MRRAVLPSEQVLGDQAQLRGRVGRDDHGAEFTAAGCGLPARELLGDVFGRPDQAAIVDVLVGDQCGSLILLACQIKVLDLHRRFLVAEALGVVVVEVLITRAHAADAKEPRARRRRRPRREG